MKLIIQISKDQFTITPNPEDEYDALCISAIHEATRSPTTKIVINTILNGNPKKPGDPAGL